MSDLHRAIRDELAAHRPERVPSFAEVRARRRSRNRRRVATGGAALSAVVLAAVAIALPSLAGRGQDRLPSYAGEADQPEPSPSAAVLPVPEDPPSAVICPDSAAVGGCQLVGGQQASAVAGALATARRHEPASTRCFAAPVTYVVTFGSPEGTAKPVAYRVPARCSPMRRAGTLYELDDDARDVVVRAYESADNPAPPGAVPEVPRFPTGIAGDQAAISTCLQEVAQHSGETVDRTVEEFAPTVGGWRIRLAVLTGQSFDCYLTETGRITVGPAPTSAPSVRESLGLQFLACSAAEPGLLASSSSAPDAEQQAEKSLAQALPHLAPETRRAVVEPHDRESPLAQLKAIYGFCMDKGWGGNRALLEA